MRVSQGGCVGHVCGARSTYLDGRCGSGTADDDSPCKQVTDDRRVFVDGFHCTADEAKFGGVVLQVLSTARTDVTQPLTPTGIADISLRPWVTGALIVLEMVAALHERGYQRLRISPGFSNTGTQWVCRITYAHNTEPANGAWITDHEAPIAIYTSGMGDRVFRWEDALGLTPQRAADLFLDRFAELAALSRGDDDAYARWYTDVLAFARTGYLPIAYENEPDSPTNVVRTQNGPEPGPELRLPPGGWGSSSTH